MDERLRFVARLLEGEKMAPLCVEFGISRTTGYKIFDRYKDVGVRPTPSRQIGFLAESLIAAQRSCYRAPRAQ